MSSYQLVDNLSKEMFRAYDVRGIVGETLTPNSVYSIGLAIGSEAQQRGEREIIVGRDGRISGPELLKALEEGLLDSGCDVINIGEVTTPILYYATFTQKTRSGVMLTGSHNPSNYNGIKVVLDGEALYEDAIMALYRRIVAHDLIYGHGASVNIDVCDNYIERIVNDVKLAKKLKVVIDCGNGVGGKVAPKLFRALGCEVIELYCDVDGYFPNHHPDPSNIDNLRDLIAATTANKANVGFAFDGDADRIGLVTDKGEIITPDRLLMFFVTDILSRYEAGVIPFDVKCSRHLAAKIHELGGTPLMTRTGHSLVKAKMREVGAPIAGEFSGHIFFQDRWFGFDDGMYAAARFLELLAKSWRKCSAIFAAFPESFNTSELKIVMSDAEKFGFVEKLLKNNNFEGGQISSIDGVRVDFPDGFGLVRCSNTTPTIILRFEGDTLEALQRIKNIFREKLLAIKPDLELPL